MSTTPVIETLPQAQAYAARACCSGCQKAGYLSANWVARPESSTGVARIALRATPVEDSGRATQPGMTYLRRVRHVLGLKASTLGLGNGTR